MRTATTEVWDAKSRRMMPRFLTQSQALARYRRMLFAANPELSNDPSALKIVVACRMGKTNDVNIRAMGVQVSAPSYSSRWTCIESHRSHCETWIEVDYRRIKKN